MVPLHATRESRDARDRRDAPSRCFFATRSIDRSIDRSIARVSSVKTPSRRTRIVWWSPPPSERPEERFFQKRTDYDAQASLRPSDTVASSGMSSSTEEQHKTQCNNHITLESFRTFIFCNFCCCVTQMIVLELEFLVVSSVKGTTRNSNYSTKICVTQQKSWQNKNP